MKCLMTLFLLATSAMTLASPLPDPTRPPDMVIKATPEQPLVERELESILLGDHRRIAVIDGVTLSEGESSGDLRVIRIHPGHVDIVDGGRERTLFPAPLPDVRTSQ